MKAEIQDKLLRFLNDALPFTEECQVVYLLVEIRKILDRENSSAFPILRFYADWSVHTEKDRITPQIETIMEGIRDEIKERQDKRTFVDPRPELIPFVSMDQLKNEMDEFLQRHSLPDALILRDNWLAFRNLLARVLTDQPINDPCAGIISFAYKPANPSREVHVQFCERAGVWIISKAQFVFSQNATSRSWFNFNSAGFHTFKPS